MNKVAVIFSGRLSQYLGMGRQVYDQYEFVRRLFEQAGDLFHLPMESICFSQSEYDLRKLMVLDPAVFLIDVAMYRVFQHETGIIPALAAGYGVGEFAALVCSGALSIEDAIQLVKHKAQWLEEWGQQCQGAMWQVCGCPVWEIEEMVKKEKGMVEIACYNHAQDHILSGVGESVQRIVDRLSATGAEVTQLATKTALHSAQMISVAGRLMVELDNIQFSQFEFPIISNAYARGYQPQYVADTLRQQVIRPIQWQATISQFEQEGVTDFIEIGPGQKLKKMLLYEQSLFNVYAIDHQPDRTAIQQKSEALKQQTASIKLSVADADKIICDFILSLCACLPNQSNAAGWVSGCYQEIEKIKEVLLDQNRGIDRNKVNHLFHQLLQYKDIDEAEKKQYQKRFIGYNAMMELD